MRKLVAAVAVVLSVACASASPSLAQPTDTATAEPRRLALLVGIDGYTVVNDLRGCENDVHDMKNLLENRFGFDDSGVRTLLSAEATRANILATFRSHLIAKAREGDVVVFHYSGHGSRQKDVSGDEIDGWDETIVPSDSRQGNIFDITDDEINGLVRELLAKTNNVTVILDSCHSGSAARAGATVRRVADDTRTPPAAGAVSGGGTREGTTDLRELALDYVLLSAARPDELANEFSTNEGLQRGALTYYLTRALRPPGSEALTYRDLHEIVRSDVTDSFPSQHPQLEGLRMDNVVFGVATAGSEASLLVSSGPSGGAVVQGGAAYGLRAGAKMDVYPPRTRTFDGEPSAVVELTQAGPFESQARVTRGSIAPRSRAAVRSLIFPEGTLRLHFESATDPLVTSVRARLSEIRAIQAVDEPSRSQLILRATPEGYAFFSGDLQQVSPAVPRDAANAVTRLVMQADHWAKWHRILAIHNPAIPPGVEVEVRRTGAASPSRSFVNGDQIDVNVRNVTGKNLYITIVDLSNDGSSGVWYPEAGVQEFLAPGASMTQQVVLGVPDGRASVTDVIKVFATASPLNPAAFLLGSVRAGESPQFSDDPLAGFLERQARGSRSGTPVQVAGWSARDVTIEIRQDAPRLGGFIAHYETRDVDIVNTARAALPPCGPGGADAQCYDVSEFAPDGTVEITAGATRGGRSAPSSTGDAWDEAYRLRETTGASRVEPMLEVEVADLAPEGPGGTRSGAARPDRPGAKADNLWSLRHANVLEAWSMLQAGGRADGAEGASVTIGHPDTGYRRHPEIWHLDPAKSPIDSSAGYDYVTSADDPFDPLDRSGLLTNPGHGTKSSSAIVSPKGKQWTGGGAGDFVSGVAPGARLVPLRVHRSVVHFNPSSLARAIYDAASDDRTRVKRRADVISISMGGLPSWGLWKAVRFAEKQGTIVVSAAGNEVGFVVWPARFDEAVAMAASNVDCGIWSGSSRGRAVDVTAPGESVWHAGVDRDAKETIGLGQGTTFATATTAGIAALWLDHHRNSAAMRALRAAGKQTQAFRNALRATSWRPSEDRATWPRGVNCTERAPWNAAIFGAGIVNAAAALRHPLPPLGGVRGDALEVDRSLSDLPLFASLFLEETAQPVVRERYQAIFASAPGDDLAKFEAEIVQQIAINHDVRAATEGIIGPEAPRAQQYALVRDALLRSDVSSRLRAALRPQ